MMGGSAQRSNQDGISENTDLIQVVPDQASIGGRHSASVSITLHADGIVIPLGPVFGGFARVNPNAPEFPTIAPCKAQITTSIDSTITSKEYYLPEGIPAGKGTKFPVQPIA